MRPQPNTPTTERGRVVFRPLWPAAWQAASSRWSVFADWCRRLADAGVAEFVRIRAAVGWALPTIRFTLDTRARRSRRRHKSLQEMLVSRRIFEVLEARAMLSIIANADQYSTLNTQPLSVAAPGVLANDTDTGGYQMTAHLSTGTSHGTTTLNGDGSFTYTPNTGFDGQDSFTYYDTDTAGNVSNTATATITVVFGVLSDVDQTKLPADTLQFPMQVLGDAAGQPATAANLSLVYNSDTADPQQVLEQDFQPSMVPVTSATLVVSGTFNGSQLANAFVTTGNLTGNNPLIRLAEEVSTSSLASGRYAYTQTVSDITSQGSTLLSTLNGAANVVNDATSPFGAGWDMPRLDHIFTNSAQNVPAGVLLSTGDGNSFYFTQGSGNSYTSPAGPEAFSTLTSLTGGGWQLLDQYGTIDTFNSSGFLTSSELRNTETTSYTWTGSDLTKITDPFARSVALAYTSGLLSSITDFAANVWSFSYNTSHQLTSITEPNPGGGSPVWSFGYTTANLMTSSTDPNSNATDFGFSSYNNLSGETLPGGAGEAYDSEQNYGYGSPNQSAPANAVLSSSVQNSTTDPNGNTSHFLTDLLGNVTSYSDPYGNVTTYTRNANGLLTQLTQPPPEAGQQAPVTNYNYDSLANLTSATGALTTYGTRTYNSFSEPTQFVSALNETTAWSYDSHGNFLSKTDALGNVISFTVDTYGNPLTMAQPAPNNATGTITTSYAYDSYERPVKITYPDTSTRSLAYDADDRLTSVTDEDSHTTSESYDALGRLVKITYPNTGTVTYRYDKDANKLTSVDQLSNTTSYAYNARNELTSVTLPNPGSGSPVWSYTYDANGNVLTVQDPLLNTTTDAYDKMNRLTSETLPNAGNGSPVITWTYDNLGRKLTEVNALSGTTTWAYKTNNLVTSVTAPPQVSGGQSPVTSRTYDADGRLSTVTNPVSQTTTIGYDADGHTTSVKDNLGDTTTNAFGHDGELLSTTDPLSHTASYQ